MESENTKSEAQELDLGESIDALLGEIDVSCAHFEKQPDSPADASGLISDDGTEPDISDQIAENNADGAGAESLPADSNENDADDATEESVEELSGADSVGEDALEALDAVSQSAEALLEESIGELLDGVKEAGGVDAQDDAQGEGETADAPAEESDSEEVVEEGAVEEAVEETVEDAGEEAVVEEEVEEETGESEPSGEDAAGLLDSINEELLSSLEDEQIEAVHAIDDAQPVDETLDEDQQVEETDQVVEETPDQDTGDDAHDEVEDSVAEESAAEEEIQAVEEDDADESELDAASDDQLGNLDDALAGLGDELLMGDFEDADGEMVEANEIEGSIDPALLLDQLDLSDKQQADDEPEPVHETEVETSDVGASGDQSMATQEADGKSAAEQVESATEEASVSVARVPEAIKTSAVDDETTQQAQADADTQIESIWQTLLRIGRNRGVGLVSVVRTQMGPIGAKGVLLLSKPIAEKPASVRNSVGYIAIWTVFLAMVLWIYVMFFRSSEPEVPTKAPTRVVMPGEDLEPIEHQMATQPAKP